MSVCLSVCLSRRSVLPVTVARSSSDSNALCYVFSVSVLDVVIFINSNCSCRLIETVIFNKN